MPSKRSRVPLTLKTKYRVTNWAENDRGLVDRGDLTLWTSQAAIPRLRAHTADSAGTQTLAVEDEAASGAAVTRRPGTRDRVPLGCIIMSQMLELGRPRSVAVVA